MQKHEIIAIFALLTVCADFWQERLCVSHSWFLARTKATTEEWSATIVYVLCIFVAKKIKKLLWMKIESWMRECTLWNGKEEKGNRMQQVNKCAWEKKERINKIFMLFTFEAAHCLPHPVRQFFYSFSYHHKMNKNNSRTKKKWCVDCQFDAT